jgi:hypothetical protein
MLAHFVGVFWPAASKRAPVGHPDPDAEEAVRQTRKGGQRIALPGGESSAASSDDLPWELREDAK